MSDARQGPLDVDRWNASDFFTWAGLRLTEAARGRARLVLDVAQHHRGGAGGPAINGGIIAYLFDAVCAAAVASTWDEGVTSQATVQLSVSYHRLLLVQRCAAAEAEVVQRGGSTAFVDARVLDEAGRTCAVAHGIYHFFRQRGRGRVRGGGAAARSGRHADTQAGTQAGGQAGGQAGTQAGGQDAGANAQQRPADDGVGSAPDGAPEQRRAEQRTNGKRGRGARPARGGTRTRSASGPGEGSRA